MILLLAATGLSYDPALARTLVGFAAIAYQSDNNIRFWNCTLCGAFNLQDAGPYSSLVYDAGGYAGYSKELDAIIVALRGPRDARQFILDLDFSMVNYGYCAGCSVDKIYGTMHDAVRSQLKTYVQSFLRVRYPNAQVILTGHSIGGALATLFAVECLSLGATVKAVYTFGGSRVGNDKFSYYITANFFTKFFRVVHYADAVVHYPALNMNYKHSAQEIFYSEDMKHFRMCDAVNGEDYQCSDSVSVLQYNFDDNALETYAKI